MLDIADAANQYAPVRPPDTVAGLAKTASSDGAVGVYGRGPDPGDRDPAARPRGRRAARPARRHARRRAVADERTVVTVGPLGVMLTGEAGDGGWLLAGTLTRDALVQAADDVLAGFVFIEDDR